MFIGFTSEAFKTVWLRRQTLGMLGPCSRALMHYNISSRAVTPEC